MVSLWKSHELASAYLNKEGTGSSTMRVTAGNDMPVTMVTIPNTATPSLEGLKQSQRRTKFLTEITKAVNSSNKATNETRNLVCSLLARDPDYKVPLTIIVRADETRKNSWRIFPLQAQNVRVTATTF